MKYNIIERDEQIHKEEECVGSRLTGMTVQLSYANQGTL